VRLNCSQFQGVYKLPKCRTCIRNIAANLFNLNWFLDVPNESNERVKSSQSVKLDDSLDSTYFYFFKIKFFINLESVGIRPWDSNQELISIVGTIVQPSLVDSVSSTACLQLNVVEVAGSCAN
jgi:hypothetical protein